MQDFLANTALCLHSNQFNVAFLVAATDWLWNYVDDESRFAECTQICVSQFDYVLLVLFAYGESINANVQVSTINRVSNCAQHQIDDDDDDTHHHLHKSMRKSIYLSEYIYMYSEEGL